MYRPVRVPSMDRIPVDESPSPEAVEDDTPQAYRVPDPSPPPWQPARVEEKSVALAIILAVLVPGLGHMYLRRFAQGLAILIVVAVLLLLFFLIVTVVAAVAIWIWQIYDAYRTARDYNRSVRESGARPW
jgi:TM2 domain-containing membrane protein YozV